MLAQDHGQDVRAAGGGPDVKDDGRAHGRQEHRKADVEPEVAGDGLGHGEEPLEERGVARERKRREGAPEHRLAVQEGEPQAHEHGVQDPHVDGDGQRRDGGVEQDGKARGAAEGQVVGRLEEHERHGREDEAHVEQAEELREAVGHALLGEPLATRLLVLRHDLRDRLHRRLQLLVHRTLPSAHAKRTRFVWHVLLAFGVGSLAGSTPWRAPVARMRRLVFPEIPSYASFDLIFFIRKPRIVDILTHYSALRIKNLKPNDAQSQESEKASLRMLNGKKNNREEPPLRPYPAVCLATNERPSLPTAEAAASLRRIFRVAQSCVRSGGLCRW